MNKKWIKLDLRVLWECIHTPYCTLSIVYTFSNHFGLYN
jgi:hypothetical protein